MTPKTVVMCLLAGSALAKQASISQNQVQAREQSLEVTWSRELDARYESPVKRVVNLLSKMRAELKSEADKEAEMYDKMVCWCDSNEKEKTAAIAAADAKDDQLVTEIEERSSRAGELGAETETAKKEIATNTEVLKKAVAIREEEAAKFREDETESVQAVTNLRNAISVLSKHQSFLQVRGPVLAGIRVVLKDAALRYEEMTAGRAELQQFDSHAEGAAFVSVGKGTMRRDVEGISAEMLRSIGERDSQALPLKFAALVVAKEAQTSSPVRGTGFLQTGDRQPLYESRSSARSSEIFGIMQTMLTEFEESLSQTQKTERQAAEDHKALADAKSAEIEAGKKKLDEMETNAVDNKRALSDAKEDLSLTRDQRSADTKFLQNLNLQCNDLDDQWKKRSETRSAEMVAVSEAIAILTEDDNREMLAKSVTLLQQRSETSAATRAQRASAASVLRQAAQEPSFDADDLLAAWHGRHIATLGAAAGPRAQLSTLAVAVQLDSFTKVKAMMDKMMSDLKAEQAEEVAFKANCREEFDSTQKSTYDKTEMKNDLESSIDQLKEKIEQLDSEIDAAKKQMAQASLEIKKAGQTREVENSEFQSVVADQRATQDILKKAVQKLKDFYQKGIGQVVLSQRSAQEPPVKFNSFKTNAGGSSVISFIEQILGDSKALEAETTAGEYKAQKDYETFVQDSNNLIKDLQEEVISKSNGIASSKRNVAEASSDLESTEGELESLKAYDSDLHNQCDFVMKNFDIRQKARLQEIDAIQAAKGFLSGAK